MNPKYWLYANPSDGPSSDIIKTLTNKFPQVVCCTSLEQLLQLISNDDQHIVFTIQPTDVSNPDRKSKEEWQADIQQLISKPIQCVWVISEMFDIRTNAEWASKFSNLLIVVPGQHNFGMAHYPWVTWQNWLQDAVDVYKHPTMQQYINTLDPVKSKPMLFDALLGGERSYRTLLHDWIEEDTQLSLQTIMTYYGGVTTRPRIIVEPDMILSGEITHTGTQCDFRDMCAKFSVIPPVSVYQQTAYSIVTETIAQHNRVFFTEKIARVIACRRLFIAFSSYRYLYYLRESGFQTFGHIINESYDLEVNDVRRWRMAFEQMQCLAKMDQHQVLEQIQPVLEHNLHVLMTTDWHQHMADNVNRVIDSRLQLNLKKV